ncbi:MAG: hypothetical protein P1V97_26475 [Planctomycetota bacterium]|nr:hypothetical protein [Planctomycetota bacterium]
MRNPWKILFSCMCLLIATGCPNSNENQVPSETQHNERERKEAKESLKKTSFLEAPKPPETTKEVKIEKLDRKLTGNARFIAMTVINEGKPLGETLATLGLALIAAPEPVSSTVGIAIVITGAAIRLGSGATEHYLEAWGYISNDPQKEFRLRFPIQLEGDSEEIKTVAIHLHELGSIKQQSESPFWSDLKKTPVPKVISSPNLLLGSDNLLTEIVNSFQSFEIDYRAGKLHQTPHKFSIVLSHE